LSKLHHIFLLLSLTFIGCDKPSPPPAKPAPVLEEAKVITFVTMNSPNTYYVNDSNEFAGLEYDLVKLFIKELNDGTQLKLIVANHIDQILPSVLNGKADILP
jgi:membrane-bound lytic murein transglycosylase F